MPAAPIIAAVAAVAGTAYSMYSGERSAKAQANAQKKAQANAERQAKAADEANNRANQKRADPGAALDAAAQAGKSGASGTMLTGPEGIDPSALTLGKNTLLGG
ncbi:MAG: hypothetical protein KBE71_02125 [Laribacter sp.]|nr:hypothetical protein [Laribacter sp.]